MSVCVDDNKGCAGITTPIFGSIHLAQFPKIGREGQKRRGETYLGRFAQFVFFFAVALLLLRILPTWRNVDSVIVAVVHFLFQQLINNSFGLPSTVYGWEHGRTPIVDTLLSGGEIC